MSSHVRVQNITNGFWYHPSALAKAFDACAIEWVEQDATVRSLTAAEAAEARKLQAQMAEPLPYHELPHIKYEPAKRNERQHYAGMEQVWEAHKFVRQATTI